ncbi:hypothetical protein DPMN_080568 [Dreissena polymorpha]|uniref:Uncharacterized protein n=1 Tax=Dreissena polymorpha TaxID=45954 RepID=A0A9D3YWN0_DREPO|nr:hypothetical protein DPMN_080568 [Dreissena polymorpha]
MKLIRKNAQPPGGSVFKATITIFENIQDMIKKNLLTKFHDDWTINVASRVLTRKTSPPPGGHVFQPTGIIFELFQDIIGINLLTKKNAPRLGSHVFEANVTILELVHDIIETNLLTKFHGDLTTNVLPPPPPGWYVFQPTGIIFELVQHIIGNNLLTKFYYSHIKKNALSHGSHVFQANTINVASSLSTRQMLAPHNARWTKGDHKSSP